MGLPMRITYRDTDYVYEILNNTAITKDTIELHVSFDGHELVLVKNGKDVWVQNGGDYQVEPELAQALGRSVSLRFRM